MTGSGQLGDLLASSPLTTASYQKCSRKLKPGEVKRVLTRGALVGYYVACPACRFVATYLDRDAGFEEEDPEPGAAWPRRLVGVRVPQPCLRCRSELSVGGEPEETTCRLEPYSSRACEKGVLSCVTKHGRRLEARRTAETRNDLIERAREYLR